MAGWFDGVHPVVVAERAGVVAGFAATFTERPRECYAGVAQVSVYAGRAWRGVLIVERLLGEAASEG